MFGLMSFHMNAPLFFFGLGAFAVLWYEVGVVGVMLFASHSNHPIRMMERICQISTCGKPKILFALIVVAGLVLALLGPLMLGLASLAKPRKRPSALIKAVLK